MLWAAVGCKQAEAEVGHCLHAHRGRNRLCPHLLFPLQAQFVARNGKSFLTGLASREHANPQVRSCCSRLMHACRELRAEPG